MHINQSDIERLYPVRLPTETRAQRLARMERRRGYEPIQLVAPAAVEKPKVMPLVPILPIGLEWDRSNNRPYPRPTKQLIVRAVAEFYHITEEDIRGPRRVLQIHRPRMVAYYLLRNLLNCSWPVIGGLLGGRDHTCPYYGVKNLVKLLATDATIETEIKTITRNLTGENVVRVVRSEPMPPPQRPHRKRPIYIPKTPTKWTPDKVSKLRELISSIGDGHGSTKRLTSVFNEAIGANFTPCAIKKMRRVITMQDRGLTA